MTWNPTKDFMSELVGYRHETPLDKAKKMAFEELEEWWTTRVNPKEAFSKLKALVQNWVEYGYQAATMDQDREKKNE